jgi:RHH-type proline utilization regulon transcriptional repressor/proline dehydrogenase/delta 1-pyrroline-5-carboxylate dehydrogenase
VRRLLENGANSSFVNQIVDEAIPIEALLKDPVAQAREQGGLPHRGIPLPLDMFGAERKTRPASIWPMKTCCAEIAAELAEPRSWHATPLLAGGVSAGQPVQNVTNPAQRSDIVGQLVEASAADVETALASASNTPWTGKPRNRPARGSTGARRRPVRNQRHGTDDAGDPRSGKSLPNAIAELREAVDFLRYYAAEVRGGTNTLALGPVTCISPWNFPLAIFTGQVAASLAAGNVVLAKPAEQTPLIAHRAVELLHEAGIPRAALQFLPGRGEVVGAALTADSRVKGVIFTGSTEVAQLINRTLAKRAISENIDIPLIAETGGQNAMIVDSSALPEQVVQDAISSAFDSAGQRCSALRVLFLQEDIADKTIKMLKGAMLELNVGSPDRLVTDIGPVIDAEAQQNLLAHQQAESHGTRLLLAGSACPRYSAGTFVPPTVLEIRSLEELTQEVFGPVLHVIRYKRADLPKWWTRSMAAASA